MIGIVLSFALGSVILGIVLGKLLKRAANTGTFEPPVDGGMLDRHGFNRISSTTPPRSAHAPLIVNSNET